MPDPITVAVAAALAKRTATSLYDLVKTKFAARHRAQLALTAAAGADEDSPEVEALALELRDAAAEDPEFGRALRQEWNHFQTQQTPTGGSVSNSVSGTVSGKVVQARDIHGPITFN